jgi:putative photosynthetic complex assembly protein 2
MQSFYQPVLFALFVWWFITGLIFMAYGRSPRFIHLYFGTATGLMLLALAGFIFASSQTRVADVYLSLICGLVIWAWHVSSYYLGYITGPVQIDAFQEEVRLGNGRFHTTVTRFRYALQASIYHELLVVSFVALMAVVSQDAPNRWGLWVFLALWLMHSLAKLNVFFGVRNFRIDFLPTHLHKLDHFLDKRANNPLSPTILIFGTMVALLLFYRGIAPGVAPAQAIGNVAIGTLILLGVIENLMLILPLSMTLWGWGMRSLPQTEPQEADMVHKTHTALRVMPEQVAEG